MIRRCEIAGTPFTVIVEDDGRVAYAYLKVGEKMVSDVWLYNVAETPERVDWRDKAQLPFLNPKGFCHERTFARITEQSNVACTVEADQVEVTLDGQLIARLKANARPAWSKLASRKGPLALPLD